MNVEIRTAAVIGSGVMGAAIAAHLANCGIRTLLLDIVPDRLTADEERLGWTLADSRVRNRLAAAAIGRLAKTNPAPLYREDFADRIMPGNTEDDWAKLGSVDWIIEAVTERLDVKRSLLRRIAAVRKPNAIVSTNTSGLSVNAMAEVMDDDGCGFFLGTHFFNPPRYMKLVELIPSERTKPEICAYMRSFCERRLGKGVVTAKDTPNFIANRIGTYGLLVTLREMASGGYTVEEIDAVTGPAMGRPKSATFRTLDLVGLDTFIHVARTADDGIGMPPLLEELVAAGRLGEKSGAGFYRKRKSADGKTVIEALRPDTLDYAASRKPSGGSLDAARAAKGARARLQALLSGGDRYSTLAWKLLKPVLLLAAEKLGTIADSIADIDNAMKWGYNWELGPFELWDAIGLRAAAERMEAEGDAVPAWVKEWLAAGNETFYKAEPAGRFVYASGAYRGIEEDPAIVSLAALKRAGKTIRRNAGASLIDIGDDVACLEFHSPNNAIGSDILAMVMQSVEEVRANWRGLVIANEGKNFCVGANLMYILMEAQDGEWDEIDFMVQSFHRAANALKRLERPVVAAPHRMTLGGGVELCLPADRIAFAAETYFGLVETGVGVIPAGGGLRETVRRIHDQTIGLPDESLQPHVNRAFETIAMAKVTSSGYDAERLGYMRPCDRVIVSGDRLIGEAKKMALHLDAEGYMPQEEVPIRVAGADGKAVMQLAANTMRRGGFATDHDAKIAGKLAHVLAGGDVPAGTRVSEHYLLELEREAFVSLCGEPKTQERMRHMLATGKPLRN